MQERISRARNTITKTAATEYAQKVRP